MKSWVSRTACDAQVCKNHQQFVDSVRGTPSDCSATGSKAPLECQQMQQSGSFCLFEHILRDVSRADLFIRRLDSKLTVTHTCRKVSEFCLQILSCCCRDLLPLLSQQHRRLEAQRRGDAHCSRSRSCPVRSSQTMESQPNCSAANVSLCSRDQACSKIIPI